MIGEKCRLQLYLSDSCAICYLLMTKIPLRECCWNNKETELKATLKVNGWGSEINVAVTAWVSSTMFKAPQLQEQRSLQRDANDHYRVGQKSKNKQAYFLAHLV